MMVAVQLAVVLAAIVVGARLGGIAIGYAGGLGVLALAALGVSPGAMPLDVISIIMSVIAAIAAMQVAGGMDYLVDLADRILRRHPRYLSFLAPLVTYLMTILAGTGHTAFSTMPVIVEVAKENDIRPSRPLSLAVVASQIAITASPISAAVVFLAAVLDGTNEVVEGMPPAQDFGVDYVQILLVALPSTFLSCMATAAIMMGIDRVRGAVSLADHPEYRRRVALGEVAVRGPRDRALAPRAKWSVVVFAIALLLVTTYATLISPTVGIIEDPVMGRDQAIIAIMLGTAAVIVLVCKVETGRILQASTFRSGMSASICVLGVAWLGTTFVSAHTEAINDLAGDALRDMPWLLAAVLVLVSALLYSQAATTRAMMPLALGGIGVSPLAAVAAFPAVSALFILPTYPTLLAAVEMDDTGTTRIGKAVFNHPFLVPGLVNIAIAVTLSFAIGAVVL